METAALVEIAMVVVTRMGIATAMLVGMVIATLAEIGMMSPVEIMMETPPSALQFCDSFSFHDLHCGEESGAGGLLPTKPSPAPPGKRSNAILQSFLILQSVPFTI